MSGKNGTAAPNDDKIAAAITAADKPDAQMRQWAATIGSTGRTAAIVLPVDVTDSELAEFCGWVLSAVLNTHHLERANKARGGIIVPERAALVRPGGN